MTICKVGFVTKSQDSSVGVATGYRMVGVPFLAGTRVFSLIYSINASVGTHLASYPMGTRGFFHGGKAAEV